MTVVLSALLALFGFIVLVILHELGHFAVAKAVGMRVERFSLFFPPLLFRKKIGETEYAIGALPLGGYVRISGMNPSEDLPDEVRTRAYYSQPVSKRIAVIIAGPVMNLVLGFLLFIVFFWLVGASTAVAPRVPSVAQVERGYPAYGILRQGDKIVSVDGQNGGAQKLSDLIRAHRCPTTHPTQGCRASTPATVVVNRKGRLITVKLTPVYDSATGFTRVGFSYATVTGPRKRESLGSAVSTAANRTWYATRITASLPARILNSQQRKQIHGIVGSYETTRQTILHDTGDTVGLLALISIALAVVNLFPFLPLDGGHIFWAVVELVRRKPVPFSTMERASFVGFALVMFLFVIGLTNDLHTLNNGGFNPTR